MLTESSYPQPTWQSLCKVLYQRDGEKVCETFSGNWGHEPVEKVLCKEKPFRPAASRVKGKTNFLGDAYFPN